MTFDAIKLWFFRCCLTGLLLIIFFEFSLFLVIDQTVIVINLVLLIGDSLAYYLWFIFDPRIWARKRNLVIVFIRHASNLTHSFCGIRLLKVELLNPHSPDIHWSLKMRYSVLGRRDQMKRGVEVIKVDVPSLLILN